MFFDTILDPVVDALTSVSGRFVLSLLVVGVVVATAVVTRWLRNHVHVGAGLRGSLWNVGLSLVVGAVAAAGAVSLVRLWSVSAEVENAILQLDVGAHTGALAVLSLVAVAGAYVVGGVAHRLIEEVAQTSDALSRHQQEIVFRVTQVSLYVLAIVVILGLWRVNLGGLLVGAGFLGIVVGLAARQTLGALLAGFVLMFSRPFEIGDWVKIGDKEGIVTDITIVNTRLQSFDGEYVMLPNDVVSSNDIVNRSRKGRLRIHVDVGVDYETDIERAVGVAKDALADVENILTVPQPQVVLKEFGDSAVVLGLRFWIDKPSARRKWRAQTAVIREVKAAFDDAGVKIPFPQRELMGRTEAGGFAVDGVPADGLAVTDDGRANGDGDGESADGDGESEASEGGESGGETDGNDDGEAAEAWSESREGD